MTTVPAGPLGRRAVIVVGAGPGLGRSICLTCRRDGADLVLVARREERLRDLAHELDPGGDHVACVATDVTVDGAGERMVEAASDRFGRVDGLVLCAALAPLGGMDRTTDEVWRATFETNVLGTVRVLRAALPLLRVAGGSVVLIGSQTVFKPPPELLQVAYAASKGALLAAMYQLAVELGPDGIRVNTVAPGWMWGPDVEGYVDWQAARRQVPAAEVRAGLDAKMALPRMATDGDVAEAVAFLLSDRAGAITGQTLLVNAGEYQR